MNIYHLVQHSVNYILFFYYTRKPVNLQLLRNAQIVLSQVETHFDTVCRHWSEQYDRKRCKYHLSA